MKINKYSWSFGLSGDTVTVYAKNEEQAMPLYREILRRAWPNQKDSVHYFSNHKPHKIEEIELPFGWFTDGRSLV